MEDGLDNNVNWSYQSPGWFSFLLGFFRLNAVVFKYFCSLVLPICFLVTQKVLAGVFMHESRAVARPGLALLFFLGCEEESGCCQG